MRFGPLELPDELNAMGLKPLEQGGILLGFGDCVHYFTTPGPLDLCGSDMFVLLDPCHQQAMNESGLDYLGFWHSHPPGTPSEYSPEDLESWLETAPIMFTQQPHVNHFYYPIVTGDVIRVWTLDRSLELLELELRR